MGKSRRVKIMETTTRFRFTTTKKWRAATTLNQETVGNVAGGLRASASSSGWNDRETKRPVLKTYVGNSHIHLPVLPEEEERMHPLFYLQTLAGVQSHCWNLNMRLHSCKIYLFNLLNRIHLESKVCVTLQMWLWPLPQIYQLGVDTWSLAGSGGLHISLPNLWAMKSHCTCSSWIWFCWTDINDLLLIVF